MRISRHAQEHRRPPRAVLPRGARRVGESTKPARTLEKVGMTLGAAPIALLMSEALRRSDHRRCAWLMSHGASPAESM